MGALHCARCRIARRLPPPILLRVSQLTGSRKLKKLAKANDEQNAYCNFKQNALMRGDIKRCTTREILQLKERRQMQNQF